MTLHLQAEGFRVNRKRIARLMQLHSLTHRAPQPDGFPTRSYQQRTPIANPGETARLTGPHQVWVTDIAYAHIQSGLVYASAVIDAWSREVVGYAAALQITNRLARIALHSAVRSHRPAPECIHHSTRGTQYLTRSYCELLRQYGLIPSIGAAAGRTAAASAEHSSAASPRQLVNIQDFQTWKDVTDHPREFIQTLYSASNTHATDLPLGDASSPDGNGASITCSMLNCAGWAAARPAGNSKQHASMRTAVRLMEFMSFLLRVRVSDLVWQRIVVSHPHILS
jgi:putative transposase